VENASVIVTRSSCGGIYCAPLPLTGSKYLPAQENLPLTAVAVCLASGSVVPLSPSLPPSFVHSKPQCGSEPMKAIIRY